VSYACVGGDGAGFDSWRCSLAGPGICRRMSTVYTLARRLEANCIPPFPPPPDLHERSDISPLRSGFLLIRPLAAPQEGSPSIAAIRPTQTPWPPYSCEQWMTRATRRRSSMHDGQGSPSTVSCSSIPRGLFWLHSAGFEFDRVEVIGHYAPPPRVPRMVISSRVSAVDSSFDAQNVAHPPMATRPFRSHGELVPSAARAYLAWLR
jgi:hypothetical protein